MVSVYMHTQATIICKEYPERDAVIKTPNNKTVAARPYPQ